VKRIADILKMLA